MINWNKPLEFKYTDDEWLKCVLVCIDSGDNLTHAVAFVYFENGEMVDQDIIWVDHLGMRCGEAVVRNKGKNNV